MKYLVKYESKIGIFEPNFDIEDVITEEDFLEREIEVELYKAIRKPTERQRGSSGSLLFQRQKIPWNSRQKLGIKR